MQLIVLTGLQRRVLEALASDEGRATTQSLLARLEASDQELLQALDPLAKRGLVVAWVASLSGGWELMPRGRAAARI